MYKGFLLFCFFSTVATASPWMTGPLLAPNGKTVPAGHFNFEPYGFYTTYPAQFKNIEVTPILTAGINNFLDIQTSIPYDYSWDMGQYGTGIGDYSLGLGIQVLRQSPGIPDLRVVLQAIVPTGKFDNLNPNGLGTDQTGTGSYQTTLALNFQHLMEIDQVHYLRTRFSLVGARAYGTTVEGINTFGGTSATSGKIQPWTSYSLDLAFEYSLTQHWVPVFEVLYAGSSETTFNGNPGFTPGGTVASIGGGGGTQFSLAPAIEYNFSANFGIIFGVWFSVSGDPASQFTATTLALNYYF